MTTMTHARGPVGAGCGPACAADPDLMFPTVDSQSPTEPNLEERRALEVCARCPVLAACRRAVLDTADRAPMFCGVAGGLTAAGRRAIRAAARRQAAAGSATHNEAQGRPDPAKRRGAVAGAGSSAPPSPTRAAAPRALRSEPARHESVDEVVAGVLTAHPGSLADRETVRALVLGHGPGAASRWEVALAAVVMLANAHTVEAVARALGEDGRQLRRWRERHAQGRPLLPGSGGVGTAKLPRPTRLVHRARAAAEQGAA